MTIYCLQCKNLKNIILSTQPSCDRCTQLVVLDPYFYDELELPVF
jgi:hypothetical protein